MKPDFRNGDAGVDQHSTPTELAAAVARRVVFDEQARIRIADFAVGSRALLEAAASRFHNAVLHGTDISESVLSDLRAARPSWKLRQCDFLDPVERARCDLTSGHKGYDAVLLNPPFSYRGNQSWRIRLDGSDVAASPAAAFVALASSLVGSGQLVAILPRSTLTSDRDQPVWRALERQWTIAAVESYGRTTFPGIAARTVLVDLRCRARKKPTGRRREHTPAVARRPISVEIVRGARQCMPCARILAASLLSTRPDSAATACRFSASRTAAVGV